MFALLNLNELFAVIIPPIILFLLYIVLAKKFGIYDNPIGRSSHFQKTITGSGIVFSISLAITALLTNIQINNTFWIGLTLLVIVSFIDDLIFIKNSYRFIVQIIVIGLLVSTIPVSDTYNSFAEKLPIWIGATIFGVCIINGFNFMDGINGMLASNTLVILISLTYLNSTLTDAEGHLIQFANPLFIYSLLASVAIFLFFNLRYHAKMFMGDAGSVGIAFLVIYLVFMLISKTGNITYILLFSVLGIDSGLTVIYKLILKENIFVPHRDFLFKKLVHIGKFKHIQVSLSYAMIQALINIIIILFPWGKSIYTQISIVFILIAAQITTYIIVRNRFTKTRIVKMMSHK